MVISLNRQKLFACALALPCFGAFLLLSPLIQIFANDTDNDADGMAAGVAYVFAVWVLLVVMAYFLARALHRSEAEGRGAGAGRRSAAGDRGEGPK